MRRERMTVERMLTGLKRSAGILLLLTATVFSVVSCAGSDDTPEPNPPVPPQPNIEKPIAFSGSLSEGKGENHGSTRAGLESVWTDDADKKFKVWTVKNSGYTDPNYTSPQFVMWNYNVKWINNSAGTTTSNTHDWEYVNQQESGVEQSIKYWDYDAKAYRFFGYAGTGVTVTPESPASTTTNVILSFTAPAATNPQSEPVNLPASPYYSRLWFSTGNPTDYPSKQFGQPVQLEFLKPYVKVRFLFKQSDASDASLSLSEKSFKPTPADPPAEPKSIATAGTFTVTYPLTGTETEESWSITSVTSSLTEFTEDYYEVASGETDETILAGQKKWYVVLPAVNQGTYTLSVKVNSETKTVVIPAQYMNWQPGYEYTYIFKIESGSVVLDSVNAAFTPWKTVEAEHQVYNW